MRFIEASNHVMQTGQVVWTMRRTPRRDKVFDTGEWTEVFALRRVDDDGPPYTEAIGNAGYWSDESDGEGGQEIADLPWAIAEGLEGDVWKVSPLPADGIYAIDMATPELAVSVLITGDPTYREDYTGPTPWQADGR